MNRFTITTIILLILVLIGVTTYFNHQLKKQSELDIESLQYEVYAIKANLHKEIDLDSIISIIDKKAMAREDSIVLVFNTKLTKAKNEYRYILRKQDEKLEATLDSIGSRMPSPACKKGAEWLFIVVECSAQRSSNQFIIITVFISRS